jgi:putative acyl-CoA dehydrogenase
MPPTHEVLNQPPALDGYDVADDPAMLAALRREGAGWAEDGIRELGRLAGSARAQELGRQANENPPRLRTHDRFGHRVDEVEFHPAWHELMKVAVRHGLHGAPWRDARPGAHVARAAGFYVWGAAEAWPADSSRCSRPRSTTSACGRLRPSEACSRACR